MEKRITFRADASMIERARRQAKEQQTTLNAEFQRWLMRYVDIPQSVAELIELTDTFSYAKPGNIRSRDEMNQP